MCVDAYFKEQENEEKLVAKNDDNVPITRGSVNGVDIIKISIQIYKPDLNSTECLFEPMCRTALFTTIKTQNVGVFFGIMV